MREGRVAVQLGGITDSFTALDPAHLEDAPLELDCNRIGFFFPGVGLALYIAIPGRTRSQNTVPPRKIPEEFGKRRRYSAEQDPNLAKAPDLPIIHWVIGSFCTGEMAHQQRQPVVFRLYARSDRDRFLDCYSKPVHACIDVKSGPASPACFA